MDVSGVIALGGVTGRNINTSRGPGTVYDIAAQVDGQGGMKFGTFNGDLAGQAKALENTRVTFRYSVRTSNKNGQTYTNYDLDAIAPEGSLPAEAAEAAAVGGIPIVDGSQSGGARRGGGGGGYKQMDPEVQRMIVKQNVFGTAHDFISSLYHGLGPDFREEAEKAAEQLASKLYGIITKNYNAANPPAGAPADAVAAVPVPAPAVPATVAAPVETAPIVPVATTPAEVAATVPGVAVGVAQVAVPAAGGAVVPAPVSGADIAWD